MRISAFHTGLAQTFQQAGQQGAVDMKEDIMIDGFIGNKDRRDKESWQSVLYQPFGCAQFHFDAAGSDPVGFHLRIAFSRRWPRVECLGLRRRPLDQEIFARAIGLQR